MSTPGMTLARRSIALIGPSIALVVAGWALAGCGASTAPVVTGGAGAGGSAAAGSATSTAAASPVSPSSPAASLSGASLPAPSASLPAGSLASASRVPPAASVSITPAATSQPSPPSPSLPAATPESTPDATLAPTPVASQGADGAAGPASGCSGTPENRDFFAAVAAAVSWPVYCAVLPSGWFVDTGSWHLRGGGQLEVAYKGPSGARVVLQEGVWCTSGASACAPKDHDLGQSPFGDMAGELVTLGPNEPADGYAIYVAPGQAPSWTATATNLDQAAFQGLAAALLHVTP